jgi:hypothetical protein
LRETVAHPKKTATTGGGNILLTKELVQQGRENVLSISRYTNLKMIKLRTNGFT